MNGLDSLLTAPLAEATAWSLLHLLWQGALVAAILRVALALLAGQSAKARYAASCGALVAILILPVATAIRIYDATPLNPTSSSPAFDIAPSGSVSVQPIADTRQPLWKSLATAATDGARRHLTGVLIVWISGVVLLSLRLLIGLRRANRLAAQNGTPAGSDWIRMVRRLRARMHLDRVVRLIESAAVEVPTVVGWLRPVVLLPVSALSGLTPQQVEMVLAHELAHIRRHDFLVNLMQAVVETLLFYQPAVWWISRQIRIERENCCDDIAVALCGDPLAYARALTRLEQARIGGSLPAVAANGGSLLSRVRRLAFGDASHTTSPAIAAAALVAVTAALIAVPAMPLFANRAGAKSTPAPKPPAAVVEVSASRTVAPTPGTPPADAAEAEAADDDPTPEADAEAEAAAAEPDAPEFVSVPAVHVAPMAVSVPEVSVNVAPVDVAIPAIDIGPTTVRVRRVAPVARAVAVGTAAAMARVLGEGDPDVKFSSSGKLSVDELIALRNAGVDAKYIADMQSLGFDQQLETLYRMRMQGVTPDYIREMRALSIPMADANEAIRLRQHGIMPAYVREMRGLGLGSLPTEQLIRLRDHGVSARYAGEMASAGYSNLPADALIRFRDHGVSGKYVQELAAAGFTKLSIEDLIRFRNHGVDGRLLSALKDAGYANLSAEDVIRLASHGVDADFIREMGKLRGR